jgi:16S rRNA (cytosine1402-N4)-methyltransferase
MAKRTPSSAKKNTPRKKMKNLDCENLGNALANDTIALSAHWHTPVLANQVAAALQPGPGKRFLDGTAGGGGHSRRLLDAGASVVALDQDPEALARCRANLAEFGDRVCFVESNFRHAPQALTSIEIHGDLDGALLDIGVSSHQLDEPVRGFSLMRDGPLDMRMGPSIQETAADLVNTRGTEELTRIFRELGEEPNARRIAAAIVARRASKPFSSTLDLADVIAAASPRNGPRHPATRVFQALRIEVNDELGALREALRTIPPLLTPGARLAVITFHSLEDRIVKVFFKEHSREWIDRPEWPRPRRNPERQFRLLTTHPILPCEREVAENPRARSAKLRVVEKLKDPTP